EHNLNTVKTVCVITEDSNSGYIAIFNLLNRFYKDINFVVIPAGGKDKVSFEASRLQSKYEYFVIVVDNKEYDSGLMTKLNSISGTFINDGRKIGIFHPISIEECMLTFTDIILKNNSKYHKKLVEYLETGIEPFVHVKKDIYKFEATDVRNLENAFYKDLVTASALTFSKNRIDMCWFNNCCNIVIYNGSKYIYKMTYCRNYREYNKINSLVSKSIFGGLINTVNKVLGITENCLLWWSSISKNNLYY
ncbi:MAG: hypothetical protein IJ593_10700, partial [Lachnospiraceae bacterium]|nr:hypothetical protein [Lachnospiraceae bacterium]